MRLLRQLDDFRGWTLEVHPLAAAAVQTVVFALFFYYVVASGMTARTTVTVLAVPGFFAFSAAMNVRAGRQRRSQPVPTAPTLRPGASVPFLARRRKASIIALVVLGLLVAVFVAAYLTTPP